MQKHQGHAGSVGPPGGSEGEAQQRDSGAEAAAGAVRWQEVGQEGRGQGWLPHRWRLPGNSHLVIFPVASSWNRIPSHEGRGTWERQARFHPPVFSPLTQADLNFTLPQDRPRLFPTQSVQPLQNGQRDQRDSFWGGTFWGPTQATLRAEKQRDTGGTVSGRGPVYRGPRVTQVMGARGWERVQGLTEVPGCQCCAGPTRSPGTVAGTVS